MMKLAELKPGMRRVDVVGKIITTENIREVQTKFGPGQILTVILEDETGSIKVNLWNENTVLGVIGNVVAIEGGYVDSFRGELQLNVGRYGKIIKQ